MFEIKIIDTVATFREAFGDAFLEEIQKHMVAPALDHDYRFEVHLPDGAKCTFHRGADAEDIAAYLRDRGVKP